MKKSILLTLVLAVALGLQAQWVNDPQTNTILANATTSGGEIYISSDEASGNTYFQWAGIAQNGWSITLQRVDVNGVTQWGEDGLHINSHDFSTSSSGTAIAATADDACVTCFQNIENECIAIKIMADGSYAWGEEGISVFDFPDSSPGCTRTELTAGDDGGVWAMATDMINTYVRYINADGTMNPTITISDFNGRNIMFGQMTLTDDNSVFVTYEKVGSGGWFVDKEIWVEGYDTGGMPLTPPVMLMGNYTFGVTYSHYIVPDHRGGGYAYISHPGIGSAFNTYILHFDNNGNSTISNTSGAAVHSLDPSYYYYYPNATVDPITNDIIICYKKSDALTQSLSELYINRITDTGERLWGEGILIANDDGYRHSSSSIDVFPNGDGFMVSYLHGQTEGMTGMTLEAIGFDMNGNVTWNTTMNNVMDCKTGAESTSAFHNGQNIIAWINQGNGKLYGQNIDVNGNMGPVEQPEPCLAPENLQGSCFYNEETAKYGALINWTAPETTPLHYNLYRYEGSTQDETIIEVANNETSYFDEMPANTYIYKLKAVYEDCESDYALTESGENQVEIVVTDIEEFYGDNSFELQQIFSISGQAINTDDINQLGNGVYIIKGATNDGRVVIKKLVIRK